MQSFLQFNPTRLWFGQGQIEQLQQELGTTGKRVLLVYGGGSIKKNGVYDAVIEQLTHMQAEVFEMSGVEPNPRLNTVRKGIDICRDKQIELILAVGGGSVIDCVKAISVGVYYDGDVWDIVTRKAVPHKALPFGTVLTLAATGSEMNPISVITHWEKNEKRGWSSPFAYPAFSILDPTYTYSVPMDQTVYGIVDMMSHVLEQYFHRTENTPMIDRFMESVLLTVIEAAPKLLEDLNSYEHRATVMYAGTTAFNGLLSCGTDGGDWASHQIEHGLSAVYDIPHGGGLGIVFPNWMKHCAEEDPSRMKKLAIAVFGIDPSHKTDHEIALEGIDALRSFWNSLGAPNRLGDYGIDDSRIEELVHKSFMKDKVGQYKMMTRETVRDILIRSLA
ncbi:MULTISPECIES: iron-containing alcohol dehydrogenase [unclassified Paenibacillus]|uniref:iron-containing alcohol dehydrogenase n=1 Tax=unclassified Paenibacillus TaxID=185978 RepID=UPI0027815BE8|nr:MULTISPECIES: iron-containing alcohol dehydrogenase [unclassified Paenibacillus]MDQ0900397.1 alcohol dehydrogenase YqhD (iron-dependent ADH family) [Paenibacillus sp. V4I7]MDQ0921094.1 alcohol dehydrogenase YqhD (iron-dependent ADH family) [Paenibacillus sp. V4I5]